jgi:hypothetical protein
MMSTCLSHSQLFDDSASRINVLRIANSLGMELLDAYIELIAIDKARTYPHTFARFKDLSYSSRLN